MSDFEEDSGLEEAAPLPTAGKIGDESRTLNSTAEDEQAAVLALRNKIVEEMPGVAVPSNETLRKFVMARKLNVDRAFELVKHYKELRMEFFPDGLSSKTEVVERQLKSGKFMVLPFKDARGRRIIHVKGSLHRPSELSIEDTAKGILFCTHSILQEDATVRSGFILLQNAYDVGLSNLDRRLPQTMLRIFQDKFPIRFARFVFYKPPLIFRVIWPLISRFMKPKLRRRVSLFNTREELVRGLGIESAEEAMQFFLDTKTWTGEQRPDWKDHLLVKEGEFVHFDV